MELCLNETDHKFLFDSRFCADKTFLSVIVVDYYYYFFNYGSNFIMIVCGLVFDRKYLFEVVKQTNHWCLGPL